MATTKITNPELFDLGSLNTALKLPSGTTAQRPTSPSTGEWRYNTTTNLVEYYDGSAWRDLQSADLPAIPSENFNTITWIGDGAASRAITGLGFKPDFVWYKCSSTSYDHNAIDSTRGVTNQLRPNTNGYGYNASDQILSLDTDGFTIGNGGDANQSGEEYVAWCWKAAGGTTTTNNDGGITSTVQANTAAGFSIVQYTGTGSGTQTVGHGLGDTPDIIIQKRTSGTEDWYVYFPPPIVSSNYEYMFLNQTGGTGTTSDSVPTSTTFNPASTSGNYIAYVFASKAGYSKVGSYTGNATLEGPIINTGFEPAFVMIKVASGPADGWFMVDNKRDVENPRSIRLFANSNVGEASEPGAQVNFLTNGFQVYGSGAGQGQVNSTGSLYIYLAFAADPSAAPTLTNSFFTGEYTGNDSNGKQLYTGFKPNLFWVKARSSTVCTYHNWFDTYRGRNQTLYSNTTGSQVDNQGCGYLASFDSTGVTYFGANSGLNRGNDTFVYWAWKAGNLPTINTDGTDTSLVTANVAAGISIAALPNKAGTQNLGHGLGGVPDLIIMKQYLGGTGSWATYNSAIGVRNWMNLNTDGSNNVATPGYEYDDVTATTITTLISNSTYSYIYYCFKSIPGFSKVGTYTGTGSDGNAVTTGFEPNWLMVKRTNSSGGWLIFDSARNSSNPRNNRLEANNDQNETTGSASKFVDFNSTNFEANGSDTELNASGSTYLYVAFKMNPGDNPIAAGEMAFLVVAGGGGGGYDDAGGAGAGGLRTSYGGVSGGGASAENHITLSAQTYTITVGGGGSGGQSPSTGGNSSVGSITSNGGGAGKQSTGENGGSGSGGSGNATSGLPVGLGTTGQGFSGGRGYYRVNNDESGGGGGGAGSAGQDGRAFDGGSGGKGLPVAITGTNTFYAGGGGGGGRNAGGAGAQGGGASGTGFANPAAATANTGGGGGTSGANSAAYQGSNGGSGVVILRMNTSDYSGTTTGSPTVTTIGSETILTYTGSGTYVHS